MKSWLFLFVVSVGLYPSSGATNADNLDSCPTISEKPSTTHTSIDFKKQVQPILVSHCMPCHFTGGKMYERLPFDQASTILKPEIRPGLFKRIKDEKEVELIKKFIEENKLEH
jgi:hypothetical protein